VDAVNILFPVIATLAGLAFVFGPLYYAMESDWPDWFFGTWLVFSIVFIAAILEYVVDHQPPREFINLTASEWDCTSTYEVRHFTGKVWITSTECSQFSLRNR